MVIAFLAFPAGAAASADCRTVTERNLSDSRADLVVDSSGKRVSAIDVMEGEVLCLRARRAESGSDAFDVVSEGDHEDTLQVELQRMTRRGAVREHQIVLTVRAPGRHRLVYRAALSLGAGRNVREVHAGEIEAGGTEARGLPLSDRISHHVLLFDLALEAPEPRQTRPFPNFIGISFVSSFHLNHLDAVNTEFVRNGFGPVSGIQPYLGFAFDGGIGRFRASWDIEFGLPRSGEAPSADVTGTFIALHAGVAVLRESGFALFPMVGIAGGDQRVEVGPERLAVFPAVLGNIGGTEDIRKNLGWFLLSLGSEYRWPLSTGGFSRGGLLVGVRGGYAFQFSQSDWLRDDPALPSIAHASPLDASGPYVRLGLGWYEE
jgi:hypothetical protein